MFKKLILSLCIGLSLITGADGRSGSFSSGGYSSSSTGFSPSYSSSSSFSPSYSPIHTYSPSYSGHHSSSSDSGGWIFSSSDDDTFSYSKSNLETFTPRIPADYAELAGISVSQINDYLKSDSYKNEKKDYDASVIEFLKKPNTEKIKEYYFTAEQKEFAGRVKEYYNRFWMKVTGGILGGVAFIMLLALIVDIRLNSKY